MVALADTIKVLNDDDALEPRVVFCLVPNLGFGRKVRHSMCYYLNVLQ